MQLLKIYHNPLLVINIYEDPGYITPRQPLWGSSLRWTLPVLTDWRTPLFPTCRGSSIPIHECPDWKEAYFGLHACQEKKTATIIYYILCSVNQWIVTYHCLQINQLNNLKKNSILVNEMILFISNRPLSLFLNLMTNRLRRKCLEVNEIFKPTNLGRLFNWSMHLCMSLSNYLFISDTPINRPTIYNSFGH